MAEQQVSMLAVLVTWGVIALSLLSLGYFLWRPLMFREILPYRPRRSVPWGIGGGAIAILLTGLAIASATLEAPAPLPDPVAAEQAEAPPDLSSPQFAYRLFMTTAVYLSLAALIVLVIALYYRATREDFGLPPTFTALLRDMALGTGVGLAAIVPVYVLQVVSIGLLGIDASHPILDRLQSDLHPLVVVAGLLAAMVVAPVFEELVYRVLLQGALERWEDNKIGWPYSRRTPIIDSPRDETHHEFSVETSRLETEVLLLAENAPGDPFPEQAPLDAAGMAMGLRHGWFPILVSSFLFALAHLGQGPSPIPLFLLAMMLGYVYQRTHRIVPCMVAHLVFNGVSMALLYVVVSSQP